MLNWTNQRHVRGAAEFIDEERKDLPQINDSEWVAHFFYLSSPVMRERDDLPSLETQDFKIYPPFQIDRTNNDTAAVAYAILPDDYSGPQLAPEDFRRPSVRFDLTDEPIPGYGVRVDVRIGVNPYPVVEKSITILRQISMQWWLGTGYDPFTDPAKLYSYLDSDRKLVEGSVPDSQLGVRVHNWQRNTSRTLRVGFEKAIDRSIWASIPLYWAIGTRGEAGIDSYLNAVSSYKARREDEALVNLCYSLEIFEKKLRNLATGRREPKYALQLLGGKSPMIWERNDESLLKALFVDRGHIAHGSAPIHIRRSKTLLPTGLEMGLRYCRKFQLIVNERKWPWDQVWNTET